MNRLKRVRFGPVFLPSKAKVGRFVEMETAEVNSLYTLVDLPIKTATVESVKIKKAVKAKKTKSSVREGTKGFQWQNSAKPDSTKKPVRRGS